jgi:hypothetical protein
MPFAPYDAHSIALTYLAPRPSYLTPDGSSVDQVDLSHYNKQANSRQANDCVACRFFHFYVIR